jgi:hypothetical protein
LALTVMIVALHRCFRRSAIHKLLHPHHVKEVAEAVRVVTTLASVGAPMLNADSAAPTIHVACTSLGV